MAYQSFETGELLQGERLLLRGLRLMALDAACPALRRLFEDACGCGGAQAYGSLGAAIQQMEVYGRRRIEVAPPCDRLTADEAEFLDAFGCAFSDDYRGLDERLCALLGTEPPAALGAAICLVAQAFEMAGLVLRPLEAAMPAASAAHGRPSRPSPASYGTTG